MRSRLTVCSSKAPIAIVQTNIIVCCAGLMAPVGTFAALNPIFCGWVNIKLIAHNTEVLFLDSGCLGLVFLFFYPNIC